MSANKEDTLKQFCDVTGADEARSRFFLDSSNWQLEVALSSFYEHGGSADEPSQNPGAPVSMPVLSDSDMDSPPGSPLAAQKKDVKSTGNTRFATLGSLQARDSSSDDEEDIYECRRRSNMQKYVCISASCSKQISHAKEEKQVPKETEDNVDDLKNEIERLKKENSELRSEIARLKNESDQGQAFYAGGSERSGQQIIGPGKGRKDIVTEMFKSVRERGAVVFEDEPSTASRGRGAFSGVGYRLGQTADDHEQVTPGGNQQSEGGGGGARSVRLRLYREGFTVDSGPLRHYTDPQNAQFLGCIRRGEIPPELSDSAGGGEVRVSLEDHRHEECPRPGSNTRAFQGKGHMLGSPTPPTVGATAPVAGDASDRAANQRAAQGAVQLDDTKPQTTIQFRLADGSRLTGRFNHSHTVADLHEYVARAEPAYQLLQFTLLTSFPSAELTDLKATLKDANLLNSTILQRLK